MTNSYIIKTMLYTKHKRTYGTCAISHMAEYFRHGIDSISKMKWNEIKENAHI